MKLFKEYRGLRRELYVLFIGRIMTNLGSMIWPMFTLILSQKLGMDATTIALYMMIYSIVSIPINLLGGKLADKWNKKNIIIVCDSISIISYVYCFLVPVTKSSILFFLLASLFQSVEWPSYDALVADFTTSADRERAYSLSYLGTNLGLLLAPTLGGLLFNNYLNLAFLINGLAIALSTVLIAILVKDTHREEDTSEAGIYESDIDDKVPALSYMLKNGVIMLFMLASLLEMSVYNIWGYLMPLDMAVVHGEQGSVFYGTMNSVNCVVVVLFTAVITRLFRKSDDIRKMVTGEALMVISYIAFTFFMKSQFLCYISIVVFTFGEIFNTLSMSPFLTRRIPASHRGRIMSIQNVGCSLLISGFQLLVGKVYDKSCSLTAWTVVVVAGAAQILVLLLMRTLDRKTYPALYK